MMKTVATLFICTELLLVAQAGAVTIVPTFDDSAGQSWTADRIGVINQAISEWEADLTDSHTINVTFDFTHAGSGGYLGYWDGNYSVSTGTDIYPWTSGVTHTIHFNADLFSGTNYTWFDPTPTDDSDQPFEAWDALSVARHELGHMFGFTDGFYYDNAGTPSETNKWTTHISGTTFDPGGLDVAMAGTGDLSHLDGSSDLMAVSLPNSIRRGISNLDLQMLSLAYGYTVVPEPATLGLLGVAGLVMLRRRRLA